MEGDGGGDGEKSESTAWVSRSLAAEAGARQGWVSSAGRVAIDGAVVWSLGCCVNADGGAIVWMAETVGWYDGLLPLSRRRMARLRRHTGFPAS